MKTQLLAEIERQIQQAHTVGYSLSIESCGSYLDQQNEDKHLSRAEKVMSSLTLQKVKNSMKDRWECHLENLELEPDKLQDEATLILCKVVGWRSDLNRYYEDISLNLDLW